MIFKKKRGEKTTADIKGIVQHNNGNFIVKFPFIAFWAVALLGGCRNFFENFS